MDLTKEVNGRHEMATRTVRSQINQGVPVVGEIWIHRKETISRNEGHNGRQMEVKYRRNAMIGARHNDVNGATCVAHSNHSCHSSQSKGIAQPSERAVNQHTSPHQQHVAPLMEKNTTGILVHNKWLLQFTKPLLEGNEERKAWEVVPSTFEVIGSNPYIQSQSVFKDAIIGSHGFLLCMPSKNLHQIIYAALGDYQHVDKPRHIHATPGFYQDKVQIARCDESGAIVSCNNQELVTLAHTGTHYREERRRNHPSGFIARGSGC
ncbi:hypothetical protein SERLA73DRAFT_156376 [Serpula lacrymans var. lacrymans S7.3]|uniref:Uncharacterized protein n=1 Tax=Serpula lacrymans var. lacrymans (strain S7.3) TaxID=936435 RepID=F8QE76_SERL3|nr:hypothetical protein SERLA73DRAFT_156376 [Serpula lacrymans var. lacrymans S7.3]